MRVSMISTLPPIKGMSPYTLGLVKELSKECEIDFYGFKSIYPEFLYPGGTKTNEPTPEINNVNILNKLTWYNPFSWISVGFKINTDILHVQWWSWFLAPVYLTTLSIAKMRGKRIIMTIHNVKPHEKSFLKNFLNNSVINLADEYIVHNEDNKEKFVQYAKGKKIYVTAIGLDIKKTINQKEARKKLNIPLNSKVLLFFGNIRDYKGIDVLLESFKELSSKNKDLILVVAGQCWEKSIKEKLKQNNIIYSGGFISSEDVTNYFSACDLAVYPYKYFDASSAAGADAISYGKPLVITNVGGLPELVKDKNIIAKPSDADSLTKAIIYSLNNKNKKNLEQDSKRIAKQFSWKDIAQKTREVYGNGITN